MLILSEPSGRGKVAGGGCIMTTGKAVCFLLVFATLAFGVWALSAEPGNSQANSFKTSLNGYEEVPAVFTAGAGSVHLTISDDETKISYELVYTGLTSTPSAAHVHFGLPATNGGVIFFLCGGGGKPACPANGTAVTGEVVAANIMQSSPDNGILAGDIKSAIRAIRDGATYANAHTARFPNGEIRGQIGRPGKHGPGKPDDDDDDDDEKPGNGNGKGKDKDKD